MREYRLTWFRKKWAVGIYEGGERIHRFSLGTTDKPRAEREIEQIKLRHARQQQPTVNVMWSEYRAEKQDRQIAANMEWSGKAVLPYFGDLLADEITLGRTTEYVGKRMEAGRQAGTIWTELNHLQIVLNWAHKRRRIPDRIHVEKPAKPPPRERRITRAERKLLLAKARMPHIRLALLLLMSTAARVGAILELKWDRVDLERGLIRLAIEGQEGRKGRATVPITKALMKRLVKAREAALTEYVVEWAGKPVTSIKTGFNAAARRAGLEGVTPHVLRHSAATWMAEDGVPMDEIAQYLGHRDVATTRRMYARYSPQYLRSAAQSLELEDDEDEDD